MAKILDLPLKFDHATSSYSIQKARGTTDPRQDRCECSKDDGPWTMDHGSVGLRHQLPPGIRDYRFSSRAAEELAQMGYRIDLQKKFLAKGWSIWEL